jgi:hypothetical protein
MSRRVVVPVLAFVLPFLVIGQRYWNLPYADVSLPESLWGWPLFLVPLGALASRLAGASLWTSGLVAFAVLPAVVAARVAYDVSADPTSHNLWPLEEVIAASVGLGLAALGVAIGGVTRHLRRRGKAA